MLMWKQLEPLFVNLEISDMPIRNGFGQYVRDELVAGSSAKWREPVKFVFFLCLIFLK